MHDLDDTFTHDYEARLIPHPLTYIAPDFMRDSQVLVEIQAADNLWYAAFAEGNGQLYGLYSCPRPWELCVVAGGTAYIINTRNPGAYSPVVFEHISSVLCARESSMLLLGTTWKVQAYGSKPIWNSDQICLDELRLEGADSRFAYASCWDPNSPERVRFKIDLKTGKPVDYKMP